MANKLVAEITDSCIYEDNGNDDPMTLTFTPGTWWFGSESPQTQIHIFGDAMTTPIEELEEKLETCREALEVDDIQDELYCLLLENKRLEEEIEKCREDARMARQHSMERHKFLVKCREKLKHCREKLTECRNGYEDCQLELTCADEDRSTVYNKLVAANAQLEECREKLAVYQEVLEDAWRVIEGSRVGSFWYRDEIQQVREALGYD